jgi:predicted TIM-barrel fold metal-dependent hydrolase
MAIVDAHLHVWTDDARYPVAPACQRGDGWPRSFTPDELFTHAKPAGVSRFNLIQISFYGFDNSYMLDMIAQHPGAFVGTAVIDPLQEHPERDMDELAAKGVRAFRIRPMLSRCPVESWLRPEGYARMFAAGARNRQAMSCLIDPDGLPEIDRMCRAYPDTPVVVDHLARIGADGVIRDSDVNALCQLARHPHVFLKIGGFYALGNKQPPYADLVPMICRVIEAFTCQRCMWESDSPFQVQGVHRYQASIDLVRGLDFLNDAACESILYRTAADFFFR